MMCLGGNLLPRVPGSRWLPLHSARVGWHDEIAIHVLGATTEHGGPEIWVNNHKLVAPSRGHMEKSPPCQPTLPEVRASQAVGGAISLWGRDCLGGLCSVNFVCMQISGLPAEMAVNVRPAGASRAFYNGREWVNISTKWITFIMG